MDSCGVLVPTITIDVIAVEGKDLIQHKQVASEGPKCESDRPSAVYPQVDTEPGPLVVSTSKPISNMKLESAMQQHTVVPPAACCSRPEHHLLPVC